MKNIVLSIIVPVYNENNTITELISSLLRIPFQNEIIIVDDGSTDGTASTINNLASVHKELKVIVHEKNSGKGSAIRTGISHATGEIIVIQDADLEYDPQEIPRLIKPILSDKADVVYGSRFRGHEAQRVVFFWHMLGNKFLTILSNMLTNITLTDMETCYKAFRGDLLRSINIEENRFGFEPEITAKISKLNCKIYEVGISYYGRTYDEGKKINWKDGFSAIRCLIKYNLFR